MVIWTISALILVVGMKYYTSLEMKKLENRLNAVKDGLQQARARLETAMAEQEFTNNKMQLQEEYLRVMREIIIDLQDRLVSSKTNTDTDKLVIGSSTPPSSF
jgi:F0F1-type ATP synthase membrane subunit b/b'